MGDTKNSKEDSDQFMCEKTDNGEREGNSLTRMTLQLKEMTEKDENDQLLSRSVENPESLESVQKYAERIKSFLGWEDVSEEPEACSVPGNDEGVSSNVAGNGECVMEDNEFNGKGKTNGESDKSKNNEVERTLSNQCDKIESCDLINEPAHCEKESQVSSRLMSEIDLPKDSSGTTLSGDSTGYIDTELLKHPSMENKEFIGLSDNILETEDSETKEKNNEFFGEVELNQRDVLKPEELYDVFPGEGNLFIKDGTEEVESNMKHLPENNNGFKESYTSKMNENESEEDIPEESKENLKDKDSSQNDTNELYMNEIRRLSIDIVKEIIETARNSVHEIFVNKMEDLKEGFADEIPDKSKYNSDIQDNGEHHFGITNKAVGKELEEEKNSVIETNYSKLHMQQFAENKPKEKSKLKAVVLDNGKDPTYDEDTVCGFGCFKPHWIQKYRRPKAYLTLFSIIGVIHGCYYSYFVSIISTLEKRYAFKTKVSGTLLLADEITPLILGIIVGYIGSRTHRPRIVAIGMFLSAACCFISGLPYIIYGSAKHLSYITYSNDTGPEFCGVDARNKQCDSDDTPPTMTVVGIFLLSSFLKGFATLSYYVIGISYMDDNIKKKNSPLYLAIALALRLLGPLVGFLMSSAFLKLYENPGDDPGYGPDDPRWVGAWWIGFFLQGVLLVIFTLPIALFPRRLPGQRRVEENTSPQKNDGMKQILAGLLSALKRLGTNPVFILLIINTNMKIFGHFGHAIMLPKYMENQFRLSASEASLYSGATSITFVMLSTIFGGYLIWKFRPRIKLLLIGMIVSEIILCIGFLILTIPRCETVDMKNFGTNDDGLVLNSTCNSMCDCSTTSYTPFCGEDGTTFFSPCYAGCTEGIISHPTKKYKEFGKCSCVSTSSDEKLLGFVSEGICPDKNCWSQALAYLIIYFILVTVSDTFTVAHSMILLRSVHPADKSIALGTFETFICLFGFIPFPVTFGALVDSACLVWERSCGETGNCWFYDMHKYSYLLHGVGALFCFFSALCLVGLYFLSPRVRDLYADEEERKEYTDVQLDTTVSGSLSKL